jgi:lipopolysaccharide export system protein LptA
MIFLLTFLIGSLTPAYAQAPAEMIGSVVKSDKWNVKRRPQKIEELSGNVTYDKGPRRLRADWAIFNHDTGDMQARGNIRLRQEMPSGESVLALGNSARHNRKTGIGHMLGTDARPIGFEHKLPDGAIRGKGKAGRADWDEKKQEISLSGGVDYTDIQGEGRAQKAVYRQTDQSLELTGARPVLHAREENWALAVQAEKITAFRRVPFGRKVVANGKTSGWLYFPHTSLDSSDVIGKSP